MHYKTIVLELLQANPELHEKLKETRTLLAETNRQALLLKTRHEFWVDYLTRKNPELDPQSRTNAAIEIALTEWEAGIHQDDLPTGSVKISLDQAMDFIQKPHTGS